MLTLRVNGQTYQVDAEPGTPLLWVLRDSLGLSLSPNSQHPVQRAWIEHDVPQCGYCQSGQIMAAAALLARNPTPSDSDVDRELTNICRCGTYQRIRMAMRRAAELARG